MLTLIKEQDDIDKIYLYAKDFSEPKYEFLITKREDVGTKHLNDSNAFIECSNAMRILMIKILMFMRKLMIKTQAEKGKF